MARIDCHCKKCGNGNSLEFLSSVNVETSPELKEKVLDGSLFTWSCPHCGNLNLVTSPFLYHDPENHLMILLTEASVKAEGLPDGYTGRIVRSVGDLIEKIKIFDSGLDDVVIEMCKLITLQEIGKEVPLKFFRMDGADSELSFAYPEKNSETGEPVMQMLAVGFNVYEDCSGIIARNPVIKESVSSGLAEVDSDWLSGFFA